MTFGTLTAAYPGRAAIRYQLTAPDVGAIARFIVGTGADRDPSRRRELVWRLLERFASVADRYPSLRDFVAQRLPSLPRIPWSSLPAVARDVAIAAASGRFGRSPSGIASVEPSGTWQTPTVAQYRGGYVPPVHAPPAYGRGCPTWRQPVATVRDHRHPAYRRGYTPWRREMEIEMETAPPPDTNANPQPDAGTATPQPPPPRRRRHPNGNGTVPPVEQPPAPIASTPDPNLAQMGVPLPPPDDGGDLADDQADDGSVDDTSAFTTLDGNQLTMSPRFLRGFFRRRRRRRQQRFGMSRFNQSRFSRGRPLASRLGRLVRRTRRVGTLRHRSTGRRFPVFGGRVGSRNFHIVARRRGTQFEIMGVRSEALDPQPVT